MNNPTPQPHDYTDLGNARRLIDRHGRQLRYVHGHGLWRVWDGQRWAVDTTGEVTRRAIDTVDAIPHELAVLTPGHLKHAGTSQDRSRLTAMIALVRDLEPVAVSHHAFDADPWALNTTNGIIDLRTGQLHPHDPDQLHTRLVPATYDPGIACPLWERFLEQTIGNPQVIGYVQRLVGYTLTGLSREHVLPVLHGDGANGKSTFLDVLLTLLADYAWTAPSELLLTTRNDQHPTALADLQGRRLAVVSETDQGRRLNEAQVKTLTGGDRIVARRMRGDFYTFAPSHTLWTATNHLPQVRGRDEGIWRRLKPLAFSRRIPDGEKDPRMRDRLCTELDGILAWAVQGCLAWQTHGLDEPAMVTAGRDAYRNQTDIIGPFLDDCCHLADGQHAYAVDIYTAYQRWCRTSGESPISQRELGQHLARRGLTNKKHGPKRTIAWFGIGLAQDDTSEAGQTQLRGIA